MITLITGLPGNGKTLYALTLVKARAEKENRPVFYARIKGVQEKGALPWTLIDPFEWFKCPANSIIVIDECQKSADPEDPKSPPLFGVRQRGAAVPIWASKLEDHRHGGVDLVLITQDPMLVDGHDRKLCNQHFHLMRNFGMQRSTVHEFPTGVRDQVSKSRTGSIRHEWSFNKAAYDWYQSAEVHTHKSRIPLRVWLLLLMPLFIGGMFYVVWQRFSARMHGDTSPGASQAALVQAGGQVSVSSGQASGKPRVQTRAEYIDSYVPRVQGLAYTAPVYDEVTRPVEAPYPAAVIASKSRCAAYSQQGTPLDMPESLCRQIAAGGFFVAWSRPVVRAVALQSPLVPSLVAPGAGLASLGGARAVPVVDAPPQDQSSGRPSVRPRVSG